MAPAILGLVAGFFGDRIFVSIRRKLQASRSDSSERERRTQLTASENAEERSPEDRVQELNHTPEGKRETGAQVEGGGGLGARFEEVPADVYRQRDEDWLNAGIDQSLETGGESSTSRAPSGGPEIQIDQDGSTLNLTVIPLNRQDSEAEQAAITLRIHLPPQVFAAKGEAPYDVEISVPDLSVSDQGLEDITTVKRAEALGEQNQGLMDEIPVRPAEAQVTERYALMDRVVVRPVQTPSTEGHRVADETPVVLGENQVRGKFALMDEIEVKAFGSPLIESPRPTDNISVLPMDNQVGGRDALADQIAVKPFTGPVNIEYELLDDLITKGGAHQSREPKPIGDAAIPNPVQSVAEKPEAVETVIPSEITGFLKERRNLDQSVIASPAAGPRNETFPESISGRIPVRSSQAKAIRTGELQGAPTEALVTSQIHGKGQATSATTVSPLVLLFSIAGFLGLTALSVSADLPVARQILGAAFLGLVPGYLILTVIKTSRLSWGRTIVLSVGLSICFDMLAGLFISSVFPLFGHTSPLSTTSILISFTVTFAGLGLVACWRNRSGFPISIRAVFGNARSKTYLLLPSALPVLTILGMNFMNRDGNNLVIVAVLVVIAAYTVVLTARRNHVPSGVYTPTIFLFGLSLVLMLALRSSFLIGYDVHTEYYIFTKTIANQRWGIFTSTPLDSCLSVSILPAAFQSILRLDPQFLFKVIFSLIFSFSPVVVFFVARRYLRDSMAFLAAIYFCAQYYFLNAESSPRTVVAIFFFALAIMVLSDERLKSFDRNVLFLLFSVSIIVSHYSTAYVYLIFLTITLLVKRLFAKRLHLAGGINFEMVAFVAIVAFLWYSAFSQAAFRGAVYFFKQTFSSLSSFLDLSNRGTAAVALGSGAPAGNTLGRIDFIVSWLTVFLVAVGLLAILATRRSTIASETNEKSRPADYLRRRLDPDFAILSAAAFVVLGFSVALPFVLRGYDLYRAYLQAATMLSVSFVVGGAAIASFLRQNPRGLLAHISVLAVLTPYLLFNTGALYQVFGVAHSVILDNSGQDYEVMYVHPEESACAEWLGTNANRNTIVYSDFFGEVRLISQGGILQATYDSETVDKRQPLSDTYFFLRYTATVDHKLLDDSYHWHDLADYAKQLSAVNLIYSNGGSKIYR